MKIVYVKASPVPSKNANSVHVMKMCQSLAKLGHDVTLYAVRGEEDGVVANDVFSYYGVEKIFKLVLIKESPKFRFSLYIFILKVIVKILALKPDVLYFRDVKCAFFMRVCSIPFIMESHSPLIRLKKRTNRYMIGRILKSKYLKHFIVISEVLKQYYLEDITFRFTKEIDVLHDGADEIKDKERIRPWKGRSACLQLGYFGHLYRGRGIDVIIELAEKMPEHDFHIIGGKSNDIAHWNKEAQGLRNVYFHGHISPGLVYKYRNSCDVLLAPYQEKVYVSVGELETSRYMSPLKIFEYMSSEKAIVCSDLPVIREVLNDETAMLVGCSNIQQWYDAIKVFECPDNRAKYGSRACRSFIADYTWDKRAAAVMSKLD